MEDKKTIKAQVSLEFLAVFSIYLAFLAIAALSLASMKSSFDFALEKKLMLSFGRDFQSALEETCYLGSGNSRKLEIPPMLGMLSMDTDGDGAMLSLNSKNASYSFASSKSCMPLIQEETVSGAVLVSNEQGFLSVSGTSK